MKWKLIKESNSDLPEDYLNDKNDVISKFNPFGDSLIRFVRKYGADDEEFLDMYYKLGAKIYHLFGNIEKNKQ